MCQGKCGSFKAIVPSKAHKDSTILVSDCVFSFIHPETSEPLYSTTPPAKPPRCEINESFKVCVKTTDIRHSEISKHLFNGTLIVQVNATLLCIDDPIQIVDAVTCKIPVDNIRKEMNTMYKTGTFTDATIKCGSDEFKVHKAFLVSQSPVFKKMFEVGMEERKSNIIDVQDISPAVMSDLVAYLYTGTAPNISTLAKELLNAADKYEISRLFSMCECELEAILKVDNVIEILSLADLHSAVNLKKACLKFVHLHSAGVQKTSNTMWKDLKDHPTLLVEALSLEYIP